MRRTTATFETTDIQRRQKRKLKLRAPSEARSRAAALALSLALSTGAGSAVADGLTGSTVRVSLRYPDQATILSGSATPSAKVGAATKVERNALVAGRPWEFLFGESSIEFRPNESVRYGGPPAHFNGWAFEFTGLDRKIMKVTVDRKASTFMPRGVTWTADKIFVDYLGRMPTRKAATKFNITFEPGAATAH